MSQDLIEVMDCLVCSNEVAVRRNEHDTITMSCTRCRAKGLYFKKADPCHGIISKMVRKVPLIDTGEAVADSAAEAKPQPKKRGLFGKE